MSDANAGAPLAAPLAAPMAPLLLRPAATVIGGGVAGLTVAHELAARSINVTVIERATGFDSQGERQLMLGGMARSQFYDVRSMSNAPSASATPRLPGEHGFRFFPSYYHHIWDTMQRIPLHDAAGDVTSERVYDNVVPCLAQGWTGGKSGPVVFSRRPPGDPANVVWAVQQALGLGMTVPDLETATLRVLRYLCTSTARRAAECEDSSALSWFTGQSQPGAACRFDYSPAFEASMAVMPVVLAAFDAAWGDCRTNLNNFVQLIRPMLRDQPKVDGVLNGPTTAAWFVPWRRHLEDLGVKFVLGEAAPLALSDDGKVIARYYPLNTDGTRAGDAETITTPYVVLATDDRAAEALSAELPAVGVPRALRGFTTAVPPNPFPGEDGVAQRDPYKQVGLRPWDRFQTLTGIQFFFCDDIQLLRGHLYFMGSDWAITGLTQQPFWRDRPFLRESKYTSVLSVDIGDWHARSSVTGKSAAESTLPELAAEVWRQIASSIAPDHTDQIPAPNAFVVDDNIVYDEESGLPVANRAPYFIPMVGDYANRPGGEPWNPTCGRATKREPPEDGVWQAEHGGQLVHWDKLVYAGTYLKTFTRLTSMEAACESGRHAVNAILDHWLHLSSWGHADPRAWPGVRWSSPPGFTDSQNSTPIAQPTPLGDYCMIWDMEDHEIPDLRAARAIDEALFNAGLPHPWELLGIDRLTEVTSWLNRVTPSADAPKPPADPAAALRAGALQGLRALAEVTRLQTELLAKLIKGAGG